MPSPVVAKRIVELNVSLDDFVSMFSDQRDPEVHTGMLSGLMQTIVSWEQDGFDWPRHLDKVIGDLDGGDYDVFVTFLECLKEANCHYRKFSSDEHVTNKRKIALLKIALADAVRRPMGVVPDSAYGLLSEDEMAAAEERRSNL